VPVTVPDVAEPVELAALELLDELELLEFPVVGALVAPLAVVLPLYGVLTEEVPPAAAAVDDVEVW
jgi:hypothetical protein